MGKFRSPSGTVVDIPDDQVGSATAQGFEPLSQQEAGTATSQLAPEDRGIVGGLGAAATSTLSGLTLGASDVALKGLLTKGQYSKVDEDREAHPVISGAGQFAGAILPSLASGGAALASTPAGLTSKLGAAVAKGATTVTGESLLGRTLAHTASAAAEGALFGGGDYLSQVALKDKPLSAEGFVGGVGHGALFGAALGGGLTLVGETLQRAKSLFPRSTITPEAGKVAASEAKSALQQSVADGDQMVELAKQKIDLAAAHDGMAAAGEGVTRAAFGASDQQIAALRGAGAVEHGQLVSAIKAYERSKVELNNWLNSEAGLDLESSLTDLRAPDVQKGVRKGPYIDRIEPIDRKADRLYNADLELSMRGVKAPEVSPEGERLTPPVDESLDRLLARIDTPNVQRTPVPSGEFGAPGKGGIKTPQELEEAVARASGSDAPATKVLGGGPRRAFAQPDAGAPVADILTGIERPRAPSEIAADITNVGRKSLPKAEKALASAEITRASRRATPERFPKPTGADVEDILGNLRTGTKVSPQVDVDGILRGVNAADVTNAGRKSPLAAADILSTPEPIQPAAPVGPIEVKRIGPPSKGTFEASMPDGSKVPLTRAEMDDWVESQLPAGFRAGELQTHRDFSIERDLPQKGADVKENAVYVARPSDLADHGIYGNVIHPEHAARMAEPSRAATRLDPIQVDITPDGKWYIEDGNHRLQQAAKTNSEVAIRFRPKDPEWGWEPQSNAHDISDRLRAASTLAEPARPSPAAMSEDYDPFDVLPPPRKAKPLPQAVRAPDGPSPMADAEFADYKQRYMGATTAEHFNAGMHYSGSAYQAINETLRAGKALTGDAARMQAALDDALSRPEAKLAREVTLYRGLSGPDAKARFAKLKPGEVIEDPAYMSTASNPDSRVRNEDIVFNIDAPKGTAAAPIPSQYDSERELLLGRGTKLRILSNELVPQVPTPYRWQGAVGHEVHPDNSVTIDFGGKHGTMKVPPMREIRAAIVSDAVKADVTGAEVGELMKGVSEATGVGRNPLNDIPTYDHLKSLDADPVTTIPSSTIRDRGWYEVPGQGEDVVKADKARKAIAEGQRDPIQLVVSPSGKLQVNDGRNRLMAAVEADKPIKVRWSYGSEPGPGDVHKFGASENAPAAASADDNSLEALLRGTKSKLDAGENLKDIGAPSREKYAADKAEIRAAQAEHFRGLANEKNLASDMGSAERETQTATANAEPSRYLQAALDRKAGRSVRATPESPPPKSELGSLLDKIKSMSVEGGGPSAAISDDAYKAMLAEKFGVPEGYEIRDIVDGAPELRVKGSGPTVVDKDLLPAMERAADDAAIERALRKHNGKNKNIGADLATAAKVIGDHEMASADLADLLGEQAPPGARARAAALREATRAQADNAGAQAASVADQLSDKTVVNRDLKSAMQRIVDDAQIDKLTATNPEANAAPNITPSVAAAESPPASAASGSTGVGKSALNLGTALEVMHAMGIGVPSLSSIPVIGPVLSLFFKARAILGVLGRKGGSIGRTAESSIAGKAAETRERILVATRLMLDGGAKVAKAGAKVTPPLAGSLATKLFPGDDVKSKDPQVLFKARMDELARAQQPNAVHDAITDRIHASDPEIVQAIIQQAQKGLDFLASKAPKQTMLPGMLPGDGAWHPSKAALETWARYVKAVNDPASVIEDLSRGVVTMEGAETLRTVYPALYQEAQRTLLELAPKYQQTMPYPRRIAISVMYQVPIDGSMTAAHMQFLHPAGGTGGQGGGAPAAPPPPSAAPAITGPLQIGTQTSTALDRRAGM